MEKERDTILVAGADGLIGRRLVEYLTEMGEPVLGTTRRPDTVSNSRVFLDLATDVSRWRPPRRISITYLCGAETSLQNCRESPESTARVNVKGTVALTRTLIGDKTFVVFPSTNLVFDGSVPFQRADAAYCPETEYGRQKAEAERRLLALGDRVAVVRLAKVLSPDMPLLADWVRKLKNNEVVTPFSDMVISPVSLDSMVDILYRIGKRRLAGISQISGEKDITYEEVARFIARRLGAYPALVRPVKSAESGQTLEAVPAHATLDTHRLRLELGVELPGVCDAIDSVLKIP